MSTNPFGNFGGALAGGESNMGSALAGSGLGSIRGAGDSDLNQSMAPQMAPQMVMPQGPQMAPQMVMPQGPDLNVTWEELSAMPDASKYAQFYGDLPNKNVNFSDALVDWGKFGVNQSIPMGGITAMNPPVPQWDGTFPMYIGGSESSIGDITPEYAEYRRLVNEALSKPPAYGDISLSGNTLLYKGSPFTQLAQYDRDPTEAMGALDPRVQLVMSDAAGWNDPLSNWIQSRGIMEANNLFGNLNYRARNGDSSSAGFDPQAYYISRLGGDAASVLNADPAAMANVQSNWNNYMSPGAQSDRADAMFGDGGFGGFLGPLSMVASLAFPAAAPFISAFSAANALANDNPLGAIMGGLGAVGGFGDFGGMEGFNPATDGYGMGDFGGNFGSAYPVDMGIPDTGYTPTPEYPEQFFDDAMQQGQGLNSPDSPLNQLQRQYNQTLAENPSLESNMKLAKAGKSAYEKMKASSSKEDKVREYLTGAREKTEARQEARSAAARSVQDRPTQRRRRKSAATAGA